jgi:hypothetical protein
VPPKIRWVCPRCEDQGFISGFERTPWDLVSAPTDDASDRTAVLLPHSEYRALLEIDGLDRDCKALLLRARPFSDGIELEGSLALLDHLQGFVAAAAIHEERAKRRRLLDSAYECIESQLPGQESGAGISDEEFDAFLRELLAQAPETIRPRKKTKKKAHGKRARGKKGSREPAVPGAVYQLEITLRDLRPPVWRRVQVPAEISLAMLHHVIQIAMGWTDSHLHQFEIHGKRYGVPGPEDWEPVQDERGGRLCEVLPAPKERAVYTYDFGDGWQHDVVVEEIAKAEPGKRYPVCIAGRRACPPEDVGGPWGYARMLEVLASPDGPEREEFLVWLGDAFDSEAFDVDAVNRRFQS